MYKAETSMGQKFWGGTNIGDNCLSNLRTLLLRRTRFFRKNFKFYTNFYFEIFNKLLTLKVLQYIILFNNSKQKIFL